MKVGEKIRDLRKKCGLSQEELARRIGVSRRSLIYYEQGDSFPTRPEVLTALADTFGITTDELLGEASAESLEVNVSAKVERSVKELTDELCKAFSDPELSAEKRDAAMYAVSEAYWKAKRGGGK